MKTILLSLAVIALAGCASIPFERTYRVSYEGVGFDVTLRPSKGFAK